MKLQIKRAYDPESKEDGFRILVDRLWPRGIKKSDLKLDLWLKDVAPSADLRKWYDHDPAKWEEFKKKYAAELDENPESWEQIKQKLKHSTVTLIYAAHDSEHSNALFLQNYILSKK